MELEQLEITPPSPWEARMGVVGYHGLDALATDPALDLLAQIGVFCSLGVVTKGVAVCAKRRRVGEATQPPEPELALRHPVGVLNRGLHHRYVREAA